MKTNAAFNNTITAILQQNGFAVGKGDAQRIQNQIGPRRLKAGLVVQIAQGLNLQRLAVARPKKAVEVEAMTRLAAALPDLVSEADLRIARERIGHVLMSYLRWEGGAAANEYQLPTSVMAYIEDVIAKAKTMQDVRPNFSVFYDRETGASLQRVTSNAIFGCLNSTLMDHADDLVNAMPTDLIDHLATYATFSDAAAALRPYLQGNGSPTTPYGIVETQCFAIGMEEFFDICGAKNHLHRLRRRSVSAA